MSSISNYQWPLLSHVSFYATIMSINQKKGWHSFYTCHINGISIIEHQRDAVIHHPQALFPPINRAFIHSFIHSFILPSDLVSPRLSSHDDVPPLVDWREVGGGRAVLHASHAQLIHSYRHVHLLRPLCLRTQSPALFVVRSIQIPWFVAQMQLCLCVFWRCITSVD